MHILIAFGIQASISKDKRLLSGGVNKQMFKVTAKKRLYICVVTSQSKQEQMIRSYGPQQLRRT